MIIKNLFLNLSCFVMNHKKKKKKLINNFSLNTEY